MCARLRLWWHADDAAQKNRVGVELLLFCRLLHFEGAAGMKIKENRRGEKEKARE